MTFDRFRECLEYNAETGVFTWKISTSNRVKAGSVAGAKTNGYLVISIDGKKYPAHRLAFAMFNGVDALGEVDHINGVRDDNRIVNLRDVSKAQNIQNVIHPRRHNKSTGVLGVGRLPYGKFRAKVTSGKKTFYAGIYDTVDAAHQAYVELKRKLHTGCTI